MDELASAAKKKNVTLRLSGDHAVVRGVPNYIGEIIYNLTDNAVKYNKPGGEVTVTVTKTGKTADITVKDTGIGIPAEYRERIFERFYREDSARSNDIPGTGLGLSIVKHAAALHDADITIESETDIGTTVTVSFPV